MTWFAVGAAVVGAAGSAYSSNKASQGQQNAANSANSLQQQQYGDTVARNQPFVTGGTDAYNALLGRLGLAGSSDTTPGYGTLGSVPTSADVMATPGYQFGLDQGQNQLNRQLNAKGMSYSGAQLKAASQFGTDYATTKYDNAFTNLQSANTNAYNQLSGAAQMGQASANNTASAGSQYANAAGNNLMGASNASGAATIAGSNAIQNGLNQGVSAYQNNSGNGGYNQYNGLTGYSANPGTNSGGGISTGGSGYNPAADSTGYWADGGPVRSEPKVGTYSPLPGGGGGGLSKGAVINALMQAQMQARQQPPAAPYGVGALPANPLTNPGGILAAQMQKMEGDYATGGEVAGPGTQTSDSIPARLSNGEHVMDAASVTALGDGDNDKGQMLLNEMRARLKIHARNVKA